MTYTQRNEYVDVGVRACMTDRMRAALRLTLGIARVRERVEGRT